MHTRFGSVLKVYRRRQPKDSPLWQCLSGYFDAFLGAYEECYQPRYGFLRPVIPDVVNKFSGLRRPGSRLRPRPVRLLQARVPAGLLVQRAVVLPVLPPEEGATFRRPADRDDPLSRPAPALHLGHSEDDRVPEPVEGLRPYFRVDRDLLKDLCHVAHECLLEFMRTTLDLPDGQPGIVMTIHTFGEYLDFHPHLHALVADGLFVRSGLFYVLPKASLKPLEELFRARVTRP